MGLLLLPSFSEIQPYISAITAALSLVTLGFLVNLANLIRNAAKDKIEILEARNKAVQEAADDKAKLLEARIQVLESQNKSVQADLDRTEKWHTRKVEDLTKEIDGYKNQLNVSLVNAGIDFEALVLGRPAGQLADEIKQTFEKTLSNMQEAIREISLTNAAGNSDANINPDWTLELAKGFMATGAWAEAAKYFDQYVQYDASDWEIQFSRALSHANSRSGEKANISAVRAYNEAILFAPIKTDVNLMARLFSYRAAMLKRIRRLDEAEADLAIASKLATREYEIIDIKYNLAGIYGLKKEREQLMNTIESIKKHKNHQSQLLAIQAHLNDYFVAFADDEEFLEAISL